MKKIVSLKKILIVLSIVLTIAFLTMLIFWLRPRFVKKGFPKEVTVSLFKDYTLPDYQICYGNFLACRDVTVEQKGEVNTQEIGDYDLVYIFSYHGKVMEENLKVHVIDDEAPLIEVMDENIKYCPNGKLGPINYQAHDNHDGDVTDKVTINPDGDNLVFTVEDTSGNVAKIFQKATKIDEEAPSIKLNGESSIFIKKNTEYQEQMATASDNCDGDLTNQIEVEGLVDVSKEGEYTLVYKVKDSSGLEASVTRKVYVYDNESHAENSSKVVYLTFDDGPGKYTGKLLDVLKKYNVKATFFVTNQVTSLGYENMIKRAYSEGHTIGLHSYTHDYRTIYTNIDSYFDDLNAIQNKVFTLTGYKSMIVRFPGGSSNTISKNYDGGSHIMSQLTKALEAKGYRYYDWNISSGDAGETTNTSKVVSNVTSALSPNRANVILQHDIKDFSVNAVEQIILYGLSHGYKFQALTMDSPRVEHHINN